MGEMTPIFTCIKIIFIMCCFSGYYKRPALRKNLETILFDSNFAQKRTP